MKISENYPIEEKTDVDKFVVGCQEENAFGRQNKKKFVLLGVEKNREMSFLCVYAERIQKANLKELGVLMKTHIAKVAAIRVDGQVTFLMRMNFQI